MQQTATEYYFHSTWLCFLTMAQTDASKTSATNTKQQRAN